MIHRKSERLSLTFICDLRQGAYRKPTVFGVNTMLEHGGTKNLVDGLVKKLNGRNAYGIMLPVRPADQGHMRTNLPAFDSNGLLIEPRACYETLKGRHSTACR